MARLRPSVVAVVVAVVLCAVLPTLQRDGTSAGAEKSAATVGAASASLTRTKTPARGPTSSFPPASLLFASFLALFVTRLKFAVLIGRHSRRLGDAGDSWRALLRGAPPTLR
jgi:hypothetical protein